MNKRFSIRIKTISFFFLFFFSCVTLVAQTTTFYDFNTSGQLATYFNGYGPQLGSISEQTTGGVSNSGSLSIPLSVTNAVFSSKDSYSMSAVGSTYRFESVVRSQGGNGYSGLGFTTTSPSSSISLTYPSSGGNTYRPASGIGVSVAGGGFIFHNGATDYLGYFNPTSVGQTYNPSITYVKTSICSGPINSTNSDGYFSCASPDGWYKLVLIVEKTGNSTFNMHLEIWRCNSEGVLLDDEAASIMELNGVTNTAIASAPSIYSYFNFSGIRFTRFDNYSISLSGGATVVTAGNPVVLTTAATQNTNATSFALSGNVTAANGTVSERGFVYGTSTNPTIASNKLTSGTGTGTFTVNTPSLTPGTYYFRSFATNASGTSYGEEFVRSTDLSVLGGITIVSSGGDVEGTKWFYSNNTIFPTSNLAVNLNASDVLAKLALGNLTISGANITVNSDVINLTNSYSLQLNSTGSINQNNGISTNGTITILGGNVFLNANLTSTLSSAPILLQATGYISVSGTIQTNNGDITLRSNAGGTAVVTPSSSIGAITLNSGSSLLSTGGNITLGGNFNGTKGTGLYAASARVGGAPGILISNATLSAVGGNINIYGSCTTSYDDGIRLQATISTTGVGTIGIYGDAYGGLLDASTDVFFGGITFITNSSTIETDAGNINIEATLTNTQSNSTYALNFYRTNYTTGTSNRHIQLLSKSGNIQVTGDRGSTAAGGMGSSSWGDIYVGSPLDASWTATGNIKFSYSSFVGATDNGILAKTTGGVTYEPVSTSFAAAQTFPYNTNYILADGASSLTIGKAGNSANITMNSAQTVAGPISIYGGTVAVNGALSATNATLSIESSTAVTQTAAITASNLALTGAGTVTLNNASNAIETIAGGTATNRLGSLSFTDASGGLTIGTIGSLSGIYTNTGVVSVETLTGDINLNQSVSTNNTTAAALIINAGKNAVIGVSLGGNIQVSGNPAITTGSGGIAKLFSGLESNSTGLTGLVGANNARFSYDETTTTFVPALAVNNAYAIYRTSLGIGDLTIVSSGGDTINTTWKYENGVISTTTSPVNINAAILQDYLSSGALTIEAGNVTISGAITSTANAAFVINSNGTKTITVNAAVSLGGAITFNSNDFMLGNGTNISTSSASNITINANGNFGTTSTTRRTISSANGTITIHADKDANGTGQLDLDYLTFNPGTGATLIRGETVSFTPGATAGPYINGTGSFTFEPSDPSFGEVIYTSWFEIDKDNNGISALTLGKIGNSSNIQQNTNFTIAGPIQYYGGYVNINGTLTSSANGDILLKGIANTNSSVLISSVGGITKSAGTGTLTLQGHGRTQNSGTISATGAGVLNLVMWSDYDGDNVGGGSTLSTGGSISTNGGHVWMGGSSTNAGSYNWNGLAVGDGPSVGASGANGNAIDIFGPITTNGGDLLLWAGNGSGGSNGIATNSGWQLNVGDGDIILITDVILGEGPSLFFKQSGGSFTLVPNDGDFGTTFNWNGETNTVTGFGTGWNFGGNFNYLWLENPASLTSLTIGKYDGMLSGSTPVVLSNSSNVTFSNTTATSIAGPINVYGGDITISQNLSTTNTTTGNILFNGTRILGTGNIAIASGRTATINVSSNSTYDGIISGTGSGLTKLGAGLLTLTKDHTYSGATTISAGDLQVGTGGSVSQASSGTINATSGVSIASGSKLILTPNENVVFAAPISGAGGVEIKGASGKYFPSIGTSWLTTSPVQLAANTTVLEALTRITGGKMGGTAITSGPVICVAYQKSYTALNNTATLQLQAFNGDSSNSYTKCVFLKLTQSGSNVMIQVDNSKLSTGAGYKNGSVLGTDISVGGLSMTLSTSGGSGYGISEVFMSGKVNFTGLLSYSGNTVLSNTVSSSTATYTGYNYTSKGTQEITDASSSFPSSSTVVNNGLVILNRTTPLTIASNMEGTEEVLQVGAAVTLTGTNTHTGNTTIDLNKSLIIGDGSNLGSITGNIINYGSLTFNRSDDSSYAGIISGSGTLTKLGDGLHTLTGLNSYTGATTITAGKLILERDIPATSSTSFSGSGHLVIQPSSNSFTNAITYPIAGFNIASTVGGLTIGKPSNTSNITFGSATTIAGSITAYGGTITANASLATTNSSNAPILLQGNKVFQNQGVLVQTNGSNITYDVTNSPWTTASDQGISLGTAVGTIATINAQGGDISLASSFASTGVTNTSTNPDVAILLRNSKIKTSGSGTVTLNGNAYDNASTNGDFIWGLMLHTNEVIQTEHGAISIAGTGGKANGNARGIIADNTVLKVLSVSGPITFTEVMPNGHSVANHTGTYFKPSATESIKIGADGTLVANSTSNVVFDVARITFDGIIAPTVVNTSGTVTIQPVGNQFEGAVSLAGLSLSNTATGLTVGKSTNTANITFANATIIAGPIIAYGGDIAINGALTATNSSISLQASGTVTQTAAITATNLELSGTGTFTLTNTSNNVGTIAGGTLSLKLGSLSYVDSNELTIGALTNPGIIASGKINIQTLTNNLNLNSNVVTDNTATDAIILNAGKSASIGTTTGGDIIVGGTPSVTTGTNGIAKLYSGSAVNSAGLTSLVGGLTNVRYETDETTTTFVPTLETGNSYAFYRETITLPPTVTNQSVCSGATVSDLVASGQDLKWYTTLEGGQALASNISVVAGTYYVSQTLSGNESARTAVVVSITPTVGAISSITGTSNLASDATTATYSVSPVSGATSYVWSLPSGLTLTGQTGPSITVAVSSTYTSGSISVYALNSCGQTSVRTITVRKGTDPIGGVSFSVTGAPILCSNATATYTATSLTGGSYVWEVPSGLTITSGQGTNVINVASGSNFSSGLIRVIYVTSSYTLNGSYTVSGVTQPSAMSGPTNLCGLATTTYSVTNVPGMTYVWSVPSGMAITGSSNSSSIDVSITGAVSGNVSVRAQNTCGISTATSLFVKSTPIMGWMTGTTRVCGAVQTTVDANGNITNNNASDTYTYSVVAAIGVSYFWTVPSGATLVSGQGTNSITVRYNLASFDTGAITVQGTNSCGAGSARSLSVSAVTGEIAGPTSLCSLTTATYSVPADLGTVFTWSLPEGISIISGQGTSSITVGITHPVKFNTTNQVSVQFTTACGGTRTLKLGVNCTDYTNLTSDYCGATGIDPYELLYATAVTGATDYQFNIYNGATLISTINSTTPSFRFYGINFAYGATYQVKVKVMKNGVYGVEGSSCTVTLGNLPTTRLQNAYCGSTGINPWNWLYANAVTGATSYRFNIYNGNTLVTSIDRMVPYFRFQGNTFAYGATYQVKIQVVQNGVYGVEGEPCSVTLESLPTIKLQNAYCGITDVDPWNWLYANAVTGATGYRFNIYNGSTLVTSIDRTVPFFRFQENTFVYGATYQVKIQVGQSGVYGVEGEACSVTIQSKPTTNLIASQCNATLGQNDNVYPIEVTGATRYAFDIYNASGDTFITTIENSYAYFRFSQGNFTSGNKYQVKVRVKYGNNYGIQGSACLVILSNPIARIDQVKNVKETTETSFLALQAYPNPFTASFSIKPLDGETTTLFYQVYDITGKMLESKSVEASEIQNYTIGADYPVGMYLVIARQGATTETFKMIKQ